MRWEQWALGGEKEVVWACASYPLDSSPPAPT